MDRKKLAYRFAIYMLGFVFLAFGITLNTKCGLGVSPIISVAYTFSLILDIKVGNTNFVLYCLLILIEIVLHAIRKQPKMVFVFDILQIVVSIIFTRVINVFSEFIPQFDVEYSGQWQGSLPFRIFLLIIAITFTGIGCALSLDMRMVPNPGDGIVQAVSDTVKKPVGFCKNCIDVFMVAITATLTFSMYTKIAATPVKSFLSVIGLGTVLAVIGVGRIIAIFNHFYYSKLTHKAGINPILDKNTK